jgi:Spy/CpxP family protein refolding chaperone
MKSIRTLVAGTLLGAGVLLASAAGIDIAIAQAPATAPAGPHGPHGWGPGHLYSKLGLTAEQQSSIKAIFEAAKPQMKTLHEQQQANHLKLSQTAPDDPNYANVVAEVSASNASLAAQRTTQSENVRSQIHALLTPAQKTQLAALEAQWAANPHRGDWGAHGGHRPPPPDAPPAE